MALIRKFYLLASPLTKAIWRAVAPGLLMSPGTQDFLLLLPHIPRYHWCFTSCLKMAAKLQPSHPHKATRKQKGRDTGNSIDHNAFLWEKKTFPRRLSEDFPYLSLAKIGSCDHPSHYGRLEKQESGMFSHCLQLGPTARKMGKRRAVRVAGHLLCRIVWEENVRRGTGILCVSHFLCTRVRYCSHKRQ